MRQGSLHRRVFSSVPGEAVVLMVVHRTVNQHGNCRPERALEGRPEFLGRIDLHALASERVREGDEVRIPEVDTRRATKLGLID